jgi:AcrR family transcriptional regulator
MTAAPKRRPRGRPAGPGPAGERTREAILRAARDVFSEQSYHAAGIAGIAERAGVPKGSFYYAFPSKDALVVALVDHIVAHDSKLLAALLETHTDDPLKGLRAIFERVRHRAACDGLHKACLIAKLTLEIGHVSDEARVALRRAYATGAGEPGEQIAKRPSQMIAGLGEVGISSSHPKTSESTEVDDGLWSWQS